MKAEMTRNNKCEEPFVIATGGLGKLIAKNTKVIDELAPDLTLEGLKILYKKTRSNFNENRKSGIWKWSVFSTYGGVTDISFRGLCKEMGCGLVYTEMVSSKALYYGSGNTQSLLRIADEERPVAAQIFGREPKVMAEVCEKYFNDRKDICIIDINMGCPVKKIVNNGEGSALNERALDLRQK